MKITFGVTFIYPSAVMREVLHRIVLSVRGILLICLFAMAWPAFASEYSPPGLYNVRSATLSNGMRVILKPRMNTRSVSIRMAVNIGIRDFPCGKRETPHFLEHLMFAGTTKHDEAELDEIIESNGGSWNATATADETIYEIDIYSKYANVALETLHEIMTSSVIAAKDLENVRDVVHREMGGRPSELTRWLYRRGIGQSGFDKALRLLYRDGEYICPGLEIADGIGRHEILKARDDFYAPNNMTLVVVGDFDVSSMLEKIQTTFGQLASRNVQNARIEIPAVPNEQFAASGSFEPVVGSEAEVGFIFRISGIESPDHYVFRVLEQYLATRLYEAIRIEGGLAYAPEVIQGGGRKEGLLVATSDVEIDSMDEALDIMRREIRELTKAPLDADVLEATKRGILLASVWALETNAGFADYYVGARRQIDLRGALIDEESEIERVSADDIYRIANQYLRDNRGAEYRSAPTITYVQLYVGMGVLILVAILGAGAFYWRRKR